MRWNLREISLARATEGTKGDTNLFLLIRTDDGASLTPRGVRICACDALSGPRLLRKATLIRNPGGGAPFLRELGDKALRLWLRGFWARKSRTRATTL